MRAWISPIHVDVTVAGQGSSATSNSGSVTTSNANDLLVGANLVQSTTTSAGTGYTNRVITTQDGDILEDSIVTTTGSYSATAPLSSSSLPWIMQMVAFRASVAAKLAFAVQPTNVVAGTAITPAVTVMIEDAQGNPLTTATNAVTMAIGTNPSSGTLAGTLTVNAVAGVATFSNLSINAAGSGYTLAASSGSLTGATSNAFGVTAGPPSKLAFTVQPTNVVAATAITPAVAVTIEDAQGNPVTTATNAVTMAIGTNPSNGTLAGTLTVNAVAGVATFSNLSINAAGSGYTLAASATGLTGVDQQYIPRNGRAAIEASFHSAADERGGSNGDYARSGGDD